MHITILAMATKEPTNLLLYLLQTTDSDIASPMYCIQCASWDRQTRIPLPSLSVAVMVAGDGVLPVRSAPSLEQFSLKSFVHMARDIQLEEKVCIQIHVLDFICKRRCFTSLQ